MPQLSRQEIESHSSGLTNLRISNIMKVVSIAEMEANNAIPVTVQHAVSYHSAVLTLYFETSEAYDTNVNKDKINKEIQKCFLLGEKLSFYMRYSAATRQITVEQSIMNSKKWRFLMHKGLQNLNYFFRFGQHDPKGIKQALELFKQSEINTKRIEVEKNDKISGHDKQLPDEVKEQS